MHNDGSLGQNSTAPGHLILEKHNDRNGHDCRAVVDARAITSYAEADIDSNCMLKKQFKEDNALALEANYKPSG